MGNLPIRQLRISNLECCFSCGSINVFPLDLQVENSRPTNFMIYPPFSSTFPEMYIMKEPCNTTLYIIRSITSIGTFSLVDAENRTSIMIKYTVRTRAVQRQIHAHDMTQAKLFVCSKYNYKSTRPSKTNWIPAPVSLSVGELAS